MSNLKKRETSYTQTFTPIYPSTVIENRSKYKKVGFQQQKTTNFIQLYERVYTLYTLYYLLKCSSPYAPRVIEIIVIIIIWWSERYCIIDSSISTFIFYYFLIDIYTSRLAYEWMIEYIG